MDICIFPIEPSSPIPHLNPLGHHRALSWASCTINQIPNNYFKHHNVYNSILLSQFISPSPSYSMPRSPYTMSGSICPENRFNSTIFLDSVYLYHYTIFVFLFLTSCTPYDRLHVHPHHNKWPNFISSYDWVTFQYVYVPQLLYPFIC